MYTHKFYYQKLTPETNFKKIHQKKYFAERNASAYFK